ncbi:MAG: hypothetical protein M0P91_03045 [Sulfuricurvum sp.]|uniref:hypothetical protein n=1 Tax=Sulfuricurvum sp. TaxID=2025608 RepID=UPI0025D3A6DD|nr:hypothetical protein [Sulfuricurvum sp.]MCK9372149.1 hypothetical protein [Sulfuricurvum sp.]
MGEKRQKSQLLGFFSFGTQADDTQYRLGRPCHFPGNERKVYNIRSVISPASGRCG